MSSPASRPTDDHNLLNDARDSADGDVAALDRLFETLGGRLWGVAFAAADAVGPAADAVVEGMIELLRGTYRNTEIAEDVRTSTFKATFRAALGLAETHRNSTGPSDQPSREPMSLLGETKDRQAALAFAGLTEVQRCALWLIAVEQMDVKKAATVIGVSSEQLSREASTAEGRFRTHYIEKSHRSPHPEKNEACDECLALSARCADLETCVRAAIPPLPLWTRQQLFDTWESLRPVPPVVQMREPHHAREGFRHWRAATVAVVASVLMVGGVAAVALMPAEQPGVIETVALKEASEHDEIDDLAASLPTTTLVETHDHDSGAQPTTTTTVPVPSVVDTTIPATTTTRPPQARATSGSAPVRVTTTSAPIAPTTTSVPTTTSTTEPRTYRLVEVTRAKGA